MPSNINTNSLLVANKAAIATRHLFEMGQKITKIKELDSRSNIKKVKYYCYHDSVTCGLIRISFQLSINTRHMFMAIVAH